VIIAGFTFLQDGYAWAQKLTPDQDYILKGFASYPKTPRDQSLTVPVALLSQNPAVATAGDLLSNTGVELNIRLLKGEDYYLTVFGSGSVTDAFMTVQLFLEPDIAVP
jgi:hypothetical protein